MWGDDEMTMTVLNLMLQNVANLYLLEEGEF